MRTYLEEILEATWIEKGWKARAEKFMGQYQQPKTRIPFIDAYKLRLDIKILRNTAKGNTKFIGSLTPEIRGKTNEAIEAAKKVLSELKTVQSLGAETASSVKTVKDDDGDVDDYDDGGRSPNDDRSDSMNPNNDSHQASTDNRSDQMNPNNDAYWSSRGR
ncbi:hypothetical protein ACFLTB_02720 [Chloroflexota bacterium]